MEVSGTGNHTRGRSRWHNSREPWCNKSRSQNQGTPTTGSTGKKYAKRVPPWEYAGTKELPCDTQKVNHQHGEPLGVVLSEATRMGESSIWIICRQLLKMVPSRLLEKALEGMRRLQASIVEICPRVTLQSIRKLDHYTSELTTLMNFLTMWMMTISWMDFSKNGSNNSGTNCCYVAPF